MWQSNCRVTCASQRSGGEHGVRWHAWGNIDWGVTLAEVYTAGGEVLMGTQRWEKERAAAAERELRRAEAEHKRRELEASEGEEAEIEVADILREPLRTLVEGVLVTPTLARLSPPVRHIVGDPSDRAIVLRALGLDGKAK